MIASRHDQKSRARARCGNGSAHELTIVDPHEFQSPGVSSRRGTACIPFRRAVTRVGRHCSTRFFFPHQSPIQGRQSSLGSACVRLLQNTANHARYVLESFHLESLSNSSNFDAPRGIDVGAQKIGKLFQREKND